MKKITSLLLIIVLILTSADITAFAEESNQNADAILPNIKVESTCAGPGATVDVNIMINNNPGVLGAKIGISYDDRLSLLGAMSGDAFSELTMTKPGKFQSPCQFVWDGQELADENIKDGVILTLTFQVDDDAKAGDSYAIDVTAKKEDVVDANLNTINMQTTSGNISIANNTSGDLNDDGNVNITDVILLRRYIAGGYTVNINEQATDVNSDGNVNTTDVILLRRYIAGGYSVNLKPSDTDVVENICQHSMKKIEKKESTCTEDGNIEYWYCSNCDKYYKDENGEEEISEKDTVLPAKGHTIVIDEAVAATEITTGLTEGSHCSVCGEVIKKQEETPMLAGEHYSITYNVDENDDYLQKIEINNPNPTFYNSEQGLVLKDLKVPGYTFEGWYDGAGANGTLVKKIPEEQTGDLELYARWTAVSYTVKFDSPLVAVEDLTYTVNKGATLTNPSWFGYSFAGWSDANGNVVKKIPVGTTGNMTLHANWTSKRNQTIPVSKLENPIIEEDKENGVYLFAYELGRIENVPLYTIKDFGSRTGIDIVESFSSTGSISETSANTIAEMISNATTRSDSWTLSEEWNDSTTISEEHSSEVGSEVIEAATESFQNTDHWSVSSGNGGTSSATLEQGASAKIKAEVSAGVKYGPYSVNGKLSSEVSEDIHLTQSKERNWNVQTGYDASASSSSNKSLSSALSKKISDSKGYSQTKTHNVANSETSAIATSQTNSREYSTSLSYATAKTETTVKQYSNASAPEGYYRLVAAGTIHVFGVVGYDISTSSYFTYTYNVIDDELKEFIDYSKNTSGFDDYENGVLPFDIPFYVNEYIDGVVGQTPGLVVDTDTGKIVKYTGKSTNVVIPRYMAIDDGSDKNQVVRITGISEKTFAGNENIKSVVLPETVTEIPNNAFSGCTSLQSVSGGSIEKIGDNAFENCTALEEYRIKSSVKELGSNVFTSVDKIIVKAANTEVVKAAVSSNAKSISIDLINIEDELKDITLSVPSDTEYFKIIGDNQTYENVRIKSNAKTTVIDGMNFVDKGEVPLKISSENVTLNKVSVSSKDLALILSAEDTTVSLYGNVILNAEDKNSMLCKNVNLIWEKENAVGKLNVVGDIYVCGKIDGQDNLNITDGEIVNIGQDSFEKKQQDTLEWVLASSVPSNAKIVAEKWTYAETTKTVSSNSSMEGYTLYDTKSEWGSWGDWSAWQRSSVGASDSREVQTQSVQDSAGKTLYNWYYYRYYNTSAKTYYYTYSSSMGGTRYDWQTDYCLPKIGTYSGHDGFKPAGGKNFSGEIWFLASTQSVPATYHTEWRYRDRSKVYTYYFMKKDNKESTTEVTASDTISDVQKWVQYVTD